MSLSFLTEGNSSDFSNVTLLAISEAISDEIGVDPTLLDVDVDEIDEQTTDDLLEGNLTLDTDLSSVNASDLAYDLGMLYNVSHKYIEVQLAGGSVQLSYTIRLPNCTATLSEFDARCDGVTEDDEESQLPSAERLLSNMQGMSADDFFARLGVPVAITAMP